MTETLKLDALIFGGGVAGLWLLNRLRNAGFSALLLEQDRLGAGQSIASQGMIHGGIKYALGGRLTGATRAIADMPAHWKRCLIGEGDVDLRGCNLLSGDYYMWPRSSLRSRLNAFLGSKALEASVTKVAKRDFPGFFREQIPGPLYRLQDIVLDVPSLLQTLSDNQPDSIFGIDWSRTALEKNADGSIGALQFAGGPRIEAQRYIFCCGAGMESLMADNGLEVTGMQRRPLRMVMVRHDIEDPVYVHCVSDKLTMTPEVTITTHRNGAGEPVWYLGGELAERGAGQSDEELLADARNKLAELFPWCDLSGASWATLAIDRAEEKQPGGSRPDDISIAESHNLMLCWPTKLTLAPNLANTVLGKLQAQKVGAGAPPPAPPPFLARPAVAATPWEKL
jgi:glycine/D-amino acid oxidase-like deaminating enzyme